MLLDWLGDIRRKSIILRTTNKPHHLDDAFIRVGRFDYIIPVLLPDEAARRQTEMFNGAEIEELVLRAARNALRNGRDFVTNEDFEEALASFSINPAEREKMIEEYLSLAEIYCNDSKFLKKLSRSVISRVEALKREIE